MFQGRARGASALKKENGEMSKGLHADEGRLAGTVISTPNAPLFAFFFVSSCFLVWTCLPQKLLNRIISSSCTLAGLHADEGRLAGTVLAEHDNDLRVAEVASLFRVERRVGGRSECTEGGK